MRVDETGQDQRVAVIDFRRTGKARAHRVHGSMARDTAVRHRDRPGGVVARGLGRRNGKGIGREGQNLAADERRHAPA